MQIRKFQRLNYFAVMLLLEDNLEEWRNTAWMVTFQRYFENCIDG